MNDFCDEFPVIYVHCRSQLDSISFGSTGCLLPLLVGRVSHHNLTLLLLGPVSILYPLFAEDDYSGRALTKCTARIVRNTLPEFEMRAEVSCE